MRITPLSSPPQALQIVELARPRGEDMYDEINVVQQDPLAFYLSFDVQRPHAVLLQGFFDLFRNCLVVTCGGSSANQKVIGKRTNSAKFEYHGVLGFLME